MGKALYKSPYRLTIFCWQSSSTIEILYVHMYISMYSLHMCYKPHTKFKPNLASDFGEIKYMDRGTDKFDLYVLFDSHTDWKSTLNIKRSLH
jgi:hypothetical protein